jgi:hypothetical protein
MPVIWLLAILFTLLSAPFIALQAYILVWLLGPAIRRAGRRWQEGKWQAISDQRRDVADAYNRGLNDAWSGHVVPGVSVTPVVAPGVNTAPLVAKKYTITGQEIR